MAVGGHKPSRCWFACGPLGRALAWRTGSGPPDLRCWPGGRDRLPGGVRGVLLTGIAVPAASGTRRPTSQPCVAGLAQVGSLGLPAVCPSPTSADSPGRAVPHAVSHGHHEESLGEGSGTCVGGVPPSETWRWCCMSCGGDPSPLSRPCRKKEGIGRR